jgi:uncharacterized protein YneF (UPF0154 family)
MTMRKITTMKMGFVVVLLIVIVKIALLIGGFYLVYSCTSKVMKSEKPIMQSIGETIKDVGNDFEKGYSDSM